MVTITACLAVLATLIRPLAESSVTVVPLAPRPVVHVKVGTPGRLPPAGKTVTVPAADVAAVATASATASESPPGTPARPAMATATVLPAPTDTRATCAPGSGT